MSITRRLMKPGAFAVQLKKGTPKSVMSAIDKFDHVVITRNRLLPIEAYTDANILAQAQYSGPIEKLSRSAKTLEGFDLSYWFGTPDGRGDLLDTAVTRTTGTLSQWAGDLIPSSLSTGTITNTGTSTLTNTYQWVTRREAFDAVCRSVGAEWRVNPDGTVDAALATTLFASASPEIIITRRPQGPDGALRGIEVAQIATSESAATYLTKAIVVGDALELGSATGSTSYKDFRNNSVVMEGFVNAPAEEAPSAVATAVLAERNAIRRELTLTSRGYNITRFVEPGDWAYVWDEEADLVDQANQQIYNGELITPIKLRVYAVTFPLQEGVGVYVRRSGATPIYTDVTDWVEWERGDVRWEVGAANLPASQGVTGTAFLGVNPDVLARAGETTAWTNFSPGVQQSGAVAGTLNRTRYSMRGGDVHGDCVITVTSGTGVAAIVTVDLPVPIASANANTIVGRGWIYDASTGFFWFGELQRASSTTANFLRRTDGAGGGFLGTSGFNAALAVNDVISYEFRYEAG